MKKPETELKRGISTLLTLKRYLYRFDIAADLPLPIGMARKSKTIHKHKRGWPDLIIFEPRGGYCGLAIELKAAGTRVFTRKGTPVTPHIAEQAEVLREFASRGYAAGFVVGIDEFNYVINSYERGENPFKNLRPTLDK